MTQVEASQAGGKVQLKAGPETIDIARRAYAQEPFATDALFVIGSMNPGSGMDIYRSSQKLDKRNRLIGAMLLQDAAERSDLPAMLSLIDRLSRLRPAFSSEFVKAFSASLSDAGSLPLLELALNENPPWANAFWRAVPREGPALDNFLALRRRLSVGSDAQSDAALIKALVDAERYAEAYEFRGIITGRRDSAADGSGAQYPPFDWQLAQSRNAQARFNAAGELEVFVDRGTEGELARKLVRLTPESLRLSGRVERQQGTGDIEAELVCASGKQENSWAAQSIDEGISWEIPLNSCSFAWLILKGSAWESQLPLRSTVSQLSLVER